MRKLQTDFTVHELYVRPDTLRSLARFTQRMHLVWRTVYRMDVPHATCVSSESTSHRSRRRFRQALYRVRNCARVDPSGVEQNLLRTSPVARTTTERSQRSTEDPDGTRRYLLLALWTDADSVPRHQKCHHSSVLISFQVKPACLRTDWSKPAIFSSVALYPASFSSWARQPAWTSSSNVKWASTNSCTVYPTFVYSS